MENQTNLPVLIIFEIYTSAIRFNWSELDFVQVKKIKPHVLLGLSGVGGVFNEEVSILLYLTVSPSLKLPEDSLILIRCVLFLNLMLLFTELGWFYCQQLTLVHHVYVLPKLWIYFGLFSLSEFLIAIIFPGF